MGESFPLTFIFFKIVKTTNQIINDTTITWNHWQWLYSTNWFLKNHYPLKIVDLSIENSGFAHWKWWMINGKKSPLNYSYIKLYLPISTINHGFFSHLWPTVHAIERGPTDAATFGPMSCGPSTLRRDWEMSMCCDAFCRWEPGSEKWRLTRQCNNI